MAKANNPELINWINFALEAENKGLEFYKTCLEKITHPKAQELFSYLVAAETYHKKVLTEMLEEVTGGDKKAVQDSIAQFNKTALRNPLFSATDMEKITKKNAMVTEMFNTAAELERKGIALYWDYHQKAVDPDIKAFFKRLCVEETQHKRSIEKMGMKMFGMEMEDDEEVAEIELPATVREFNMLAKNWEFDPPNILVNEGERVIIKIKSTDVAHGFVMPTFGIKEFLSPGKEITIELYVDVPGDFEFFTNVPSGRGDANMRGKIVVKAIPGKKHKDDPF